MRPGSDVGAYCLYTHRRHWHVGAAWLSNSYCDTSPSPLPLPPPIHTRRPKQNTMRRKAHSSVLCFVRMLDLAHPCDRMPSVCQCLTRTHSSFLSFLSWVANTQLNHWTKRMVRIRLITGRAASLQPPRTTRNQPEVILYLNFFPFSPPFFCSYQNPTTRRCHPMIIPGPRFRQLIQSSWPGALF